MANITRNFIKGRMNKSVDERLVPDGEYIDAINVRMGSTENSEIGVIENTKGNLPLTALQYDGDALSSSAICIGAFEDGANETIYWFIHDSGFTSSPTGKLDLIVSFNVKSSQIRYHVTSISDIGGIDTTLNFDPKYSVTAVDKIGDLLFFTDNINPPRFINVDRNYKNPAATDYDNDSATLKEELHVIKKPPVFSPTVTLKKQSTEETFLDERYICFGYRYRYADNDYSATSPFTDPAFQPEPFNLSSSSYLNEGMVNQFNTASVTVNTGGPLVKGIDLLFKNAQDSTIKVIEKINKLKDGLGNNNDYTFEFNNSNVFTILPFSEILRTYDNVPRFALGQTIMGNRLIYGNYIDGYNLERGLNSTIVEYSVDLVSLDNPSIESTDTLADTIYYNPNAKTIVNSQVYFDFTGVSAADLVQGAVFIFDFTIDHGGFDTELPGTVYPTTFTPSTDLTFVFSLPKNYSSIYDMATSDEFANSLGQISPVNINPVYDPTPANPTSCDGITFTDDFNCAIPVSLSTTLGDVTKYVSGTSGDLLAGVTPWLNGQAIEIFSNAGLPNRVGFRFPYMMYVLDVANPQTASSQVYEFYEIITSEASLQNSGKFESLHSNRNYEVGMLYMDEFGRSTTGITSDTNTVTIPCASSVLKNSIQATIPIEQIAPEWATHYKFIIKPDEENYEVIYSNIYYVGDSDSMLYFLLDGENSRKVEDGDRLIVKADSGGATTKCTYVTVLDKGSYEADAITTGNVPGAYMKINPNSINTTQDANAIIDYGRKVFNQTNGGQCAVGSYPATLPGTTDIYDLPTGSSVEISLLFNRNGSGNSCEKRRWELNTTMTATRDYDDLYDFFQGENFQAVLDAGDSVVGGGGVIQTIWNGDVVPSPNCLLGINYIWWLGSGSLVLTGAYACGSLKNRIGTIEVSFKVNRASNLVIFETEPQDALSDVWFESADTYTIDADGYHSGNVQTQTSSLPAIIDTDFYNCFSFGNGAESYKVRDSVVGSTFNLGNRVVTTSESEYKEAHRYADITYSGVFNEENNVNKLNEFNLGLLNFKSLEKSFGSVQLLFGRDTDILTLQEDRISYVLQGKNLLSDAAAGTALTSVPEVLGTQIARIEEYGISSNPESFVQWGAYKYFTDAKRGAVIQLKGSSAQNEQLTVVSEQGMRSWFRDLFIDSIGSQKLGGFDPYMNEYVLSANDVLKPVTLECDSCGTNITFKSVAAEATTYCVNVGEFVGDVDIDYQVISDVSGFTLNANYNGSDYNTGLVTVGGTLTFPKQSVSEQLVYITITSNDTTTLEVLVNCPDSEEMIILNICLTGDDEQNLFIHNEYRWSDGAFISPLHSNSVQFASGTSNPLVSQYQQVSGPQGAGVIPSNTADIEIIANKKASDDFVFDSTSDRFRYLRTNTLYNNNDAEMQALLAASAIATPIVTTGAPSRYSANFNMPATGSYLYLIWDYRTITTVDLCSGVTLSAACCDC
jgi:hypothetical protein